MAKRRTSKKPTKKEKRPTSSVGRTSRAAKGQAKARPSGGGAATTAGTTFQEDVGSYFATMMLAERGVPAPLGLPADVVLEEVAAETDQPIDDLLVETSTGGALFVQCKSSLALSKSADSDLAKCAAQIVGQFRVGRRPRIGDPRALDPALDRLVIAVGVRTPKSTIENLGGGLDAIRPAANEAASDAVLSRQNAAVRAAVGLFRKHCRDAWQAVTNSILSGEDWVRLVRLVHVWRFDLSVSGGDRRFMDQVLRSRVLQRPQDATRALHVIVGTVRALGPRRSAGDRGFLQQTLLTQGIALKTPIGYAADVTALRTHSARRLQTLKSLSEIKFGTEAIKVRRSAVGFIQQMASEGHVLVVGEPGAGKSGCMHDVAEAALADGADVVLIAADVTSTESLAALSADLGLADGKLLPDVLANWPGAAPAFLIIDALDAARNRDSLPTLKNLVEQVRAAAPRWRVIASIREFDLQHSPVVQDLFEGKAHDEHGSKLFVGVRHVLVRRLSAEELDQAKAQCEPLTGVLTRPGSGLGELVRNPFNLKLLVELLAESLDETRLAAVRIQVQLLDLYWERRVERHDPDGTREQTATTLVTTMRDRRSLFVDEPTVLQAAGFAPAGLRGLQEQGVVRSEGDGVLRGSPKRVSFAHNILFDYAAARLWLRDLPDAVLDPLTLQNNEDLLLFARPSLVFAFERLWYATGETAPELSSHSVFWERAIDLAGREQMRLVGRIAAAGVVASELRRLDEARPLLDALTGHETPALGRLLQTVVTAVLTHGDAKGAKGYIWGEDAADWLGLAAALAERGLRTHAWLIRALLSTLQRDKGVRLSIQQREWASAASRTLLGWGFAEQRMQGMIPVALAVACRTIGAAPVETVAALEPVLSSAAKVHRHEFLRPLAEHLSRLARFDSKFAVRVTHAAFTTDYDMEDRVNRGPRLLPLNFSKRDEIRFVRKSVVDSLRRLFPRRPVTSTRIALAILNAAAAQEHSGKTAQEVCRFTFAGARARLIADYSCIWADRSYSSHDEWFGARTALVKGLVHTAGLPNGRRLDAALRVFALHNRFAIGWAALLRAGTQVPSSLGVRIAGLLNVECILKGQDTRADAGRFIAAVWSHLSLQERAAIERSILAIAQVQDHEEVRWRSINRDQLLGCIPDDQAVTPDAQQRLAELRSEGGAPPNRPPFESSGARFVSQEEFLRGRGVPVDEPQNRETRDAIQSLNAFKPSDSSRRLTAAQVTEFWPTFQAAETVFAAGSAKGVHKTFADEAKSAVLECAQRIADAEDLTRGHPAFQRVRQILLEASVDASPEFREEEELRWDTGSPMWGSGLGRIEAAEGLTSLARRPETCDADILAAVERLAADPVAAVRYQVLVRVLWLWTTAPSLMWRLIEHTATSEPRIAICRFFAHSVLLHLPHGEVSRTDSLFSVLYRRLADDDDEGVSGSYATHLLRRALWDGHVESSSLIDGFIGDPGAHGVELRQLVSHSRGLMVYRGEGSAQRDAAAVRRWAFDLLPRVLNPVVQMVRDSLDRHRGPAAVPWSEDETKALRALYSLADHVANQVYFASGAFNEKRGSHSGDEDSTRNPAEVSCFFRESLPLLRDLAEVEFVNIAHDLLKTLEYLIPEDPAEVFRLIHRSIMVAQRDDLQYESMAADLVVAVIERYLAEHRGLFATDPDLRSRLMDVLDVFASTGWPKAVRLISRLDEAVR